ncbi:hypothetical protein ACRALDRAFT_2113843, partial [Sodiomyces alcalophilus JCM 7366]|uniref:uncharacterized protein n=1 Tax=Sodiomyces alcalophilus JCM 7366 TaxID=591952 RepID=UPI0039B62717
FEYNIIRSASTKYSPIKIIKGFTPNNITITIIGYPDTLLIARIKAVNAITEAAVLIKRYYDQRYKPKFLKVGTKVYLRLYKGYSILSSYTIITKLG